MRIERFSSRFSPSARPSGAIGARSGYRPINVTGGSEVTRGLGQAVQQVAGAFQRKQDRDDAAYAANVVARARSDWSTRFRDLREAAELGAPDFEQQVRLEYDNYVEKALAEVPASQRDRVGTHLLNLRTTLLEDAANFESASRVSARRLQIQETLNESGAQVFVDADAYAPVLENALAAVEAADDLRADQQAALRQEVIQGVTGSYYRGLIESDPYRAVSELQDSDIADRLDVSARTTLLNSAHVRVRRHEAVARAEAAAADQALRQEVDSALWLVERGYQPEGWDGLVARTRGTPYAQIVDQAEAARGERVGFALLSAEERATELRRQEAALTAPPPATDGAQEGEGLPDPSVVVRTKPLVELREGGQSYERTITITDEAINDGRPTNIPTIWDGEQLTDVAAITAATESGLSFPSYDTVDQAVEAARDRSAAIEQAAAAVGATRLEVEQLEDLARIDKTLRDAAAQDPMALASQQQIVALDPLDFNDAASLQARFQQARRVAAHYGVPALPLTAQEVDQMSQLLAGAAPTQQLVMVEWLYDGLGAENIGPTLAQLAANDDQSRLFATASALAQEDRETARRILEGNRVLRDNKDAVPLSNDGYRRALIEHVGDAFAYRPETRAAVEQATLAYYAHSASLAGDFSRVLDDERLQASVEAVTGGVVEHNGHHLIPPRRGMSQSEFDDVLDTVDDRSLDANPPLSLDGSRWTADDILDRGRLVTIRPGLYRVLIGGMFAVDVAGRAWSLDLNNLHRAAP